MATIGFPSETALAFIADSSAENVAITVHAVVLGR